jgi:hypothetical protein
MDVTKSNVTAGSSWLGAMAEAAASLGVTIQYCMPLPRHMLESTKHQPVTNARASGDYHPGAENWDISVSSLLYWAIGVAPSKDDWWTTEIQPGSPYGDKPTEPNWQMQAIVIGLSTGPNGPSDGLGFTNASLVLSTVRADGITLQPDRPATIDDAALHAVVATGALPNVRTTSTVLGAYAWHFALAVDLKAAFALPVPRGGVATSVAAFDFFSPRAPLAVVAANGTVTLRAGQTQPSAPARALPIAYTLLVPQLPGGWWLVGEKGKVVPVSRQRLSAFAPRADGFSVAVATPVAGEAVVLLVAPASGAVEEVPCPFRAQGAATLTCAAGACTCA